jgi:hypothetical protein
MLAEHLGHPKPHGGFLRVSVCGSLGGGVIGCAATHPMCAATFMDGFSFSQTTDSSLKRWSLISSALEPHISPPRVTYRLTKIIKSCLSPARKLD